MRHLLPPVLCILLLAASGTAAAQQLALKREPPGIEWAGCPIAESRPAVTAEQRREAERLAEAATQASLLGDKAAALDFLTRAALADATSSSVAYNLARALDELNRTQEALTAYCRYLQLAPDATDAQEVRERTRVLGTPPGLAVPAAAALAYAAGIEHYDAGRLVEAEAAFAQASAAARAWSDPVYNRGAIRLALGRADAAADDFRRFLEMSPGAPEFNTVLDLLATIRQPVAPLYNPGGAMFRGLLVPGLGHFTTGRPGAGILLLGTATGALTAGIVVKRLEVDCLSPPVGGRCPAGQIAGQEETRPYLLPAAAVAAATWLFGAIDAYRGAGKRNAQAARSGRTGSNGRNRGPALESPGVSVGAQGAQFHLIRVRF